MFTKSLGFSKYTRGLEVCSNFLNGKLWIYVFVLRKGGKVEVEVHQFFIKMLNSFWSLREYLYNVIQEVHTNLLNGKLEISPILTREGGKDEV